MNAPYLVAAVFLFLSGCRAATSAPAVLSAPRAMITDGMVDVGGPSLHVHCVGEGTPIVVLEAGLGNDGTVWGNVEPEIGRFTRACASDRAGMGYSTAGQKPHTNRQMARELHALLERAGLAGPYVLVGHSMGGANVRLFASEHPDDVSGMVLIDAVGDEYFSRLFVLFPEAMKTEFRTGISGIEKGLDFDTYVAGVSDMAASSRSIGERPLVVLTRGKVEAPPPGVSGDLQVQMDRIWGEMQTKLPGLSTNSAHVVAANSGHYIQQDAPRLVIAAVHEVVVAARTHGRVSAGTLSSLAREGAQ